MELRPVQTALLAGRVASRRATLASTTASTRSIPLSIYASPFSRPLSSTRPALQEAEATAPLPGGGMGGYFRQRTQQQEARQQYQERQQQQPQSQQQTSPPPQPQRSDATAPNSTFPPSSPSNLRQPWATRHSNAQIVPSRARNPNEPATTLLQDLGLANALKPELTDIERQLQGAYYERPIDIKYRLRPVVGRTIQLTSAVSAVDGSMGRNIDFAKGLERLEMAVRVNSVKRDWNKQRFHERGGLKRKRLRRERWQRKFMEGFKATCNRVSELAKQGW